MRDMICLKKNRSTKPFAVSVLLPAMALANPEPPIDTTYTDQVFNATVDVTVVGADGLAGNTPNNNDANGTMGTTGSSITLQFQQSEGGNGNSLTTAGVGLSAHSTGGRGGDSAYGSGDAGVGGEGGAITIGSQGKFVIVTNGDAANGIDALSQGGQGGNENAGMGLGGAGGAGQAVTITLSDASSISTNGNGSNGILAQSLGTAAGSNGIVYEAVGDIHMPAGVQGGNGGLVSVALSQGSALTTTGTGSSGIAAITRGGAGGTGGTGNAGWGAGFGGNGGEGGGTGGIQIQSEGVITTAADSSMGIVAQSSSGNGGAGGDGTGFSDSQGGVAGAPGVPGMVQIGHGGTITTSGGYAPGILGQSIAGGGGIGGSASGTFFHAVGGGASASSNAGAVDIGLTGVVTTLGDNSQAVIAQSVGGKGGMGGDAGGVIAVTGGDGGLGGSGGEVTVNAPLNAGVYLRTQGQSSHGIVAQSVGGGGGMGGAASADGANIANAVGGAAGAGGGGGDVAVNLMANLTDTAARGTPNVWTSGPGAFGILAQSVGGGGGAGGGAYTVSAGALVDVATAVGGSGGSGGDGGNADVTLNWFTLQTGTPSTVNPTVNADAIGVAVQSIGGGGGQGGSGAASAYAIAIPNGSDEPPAKITFSGAFAVGGNGGDGGAGGSATASILYGSTIATFGDGSVGLKVQSIGGGGGHGGDSSALAATVGYGIKNRYIKSINPQTNAINFTISVGGRGGNGGDGGVASLMGLGDNVGGSDPTASIKTYGDEATAALVQSIGGGGGNAGVGNAQVESYATNQHLDLTANVGAIGGSGGNGGEASATINSSGALSTQGDGSKGLVVQSIGGGGGTSTGSSIDLTGLSDWVKAVATLPSSPDSGGGGDAVAALLHDRYMTIGATGGAGGAGGQVTVVVYPGMSGDSGGLIQTSGVDAAGIVAQSIGGGGGLGGSAAINMTPAQMGQSMFPTSDGLSAVDTLGVAVGTNATLSIGGALGSSGAGGSVNVIHSGTVRTTGDYSPGIIAQSVGAGGGRGAVAASGVEANGSLAGALQAVKGTLTVGSKVMLGYQGDSSGSVLFGVVGDEYRTSLGDGGDVTVGLSDATIVTGLPMTSEGAVSTGFQAFGVHAQSIGGGGGAAVDGTPGAQGQAVLGAGVGAVIEFTDGYVPTSAFGHGGAVTLNMNQIDTLAFAGGGQVTTYGDAAHAIFLQSVGGGGGVFGSGSSQMAAGGGDGRTVSVGLGAGVGYRYEPYGSGPNLSAGNGGNVMADFGQQAIAVHTYGHGAFGLLAQSIGGGGGTVAVAPGVATEVRYLGAGVAQPVEPITGDEWASLSGNGGGVTINMPNTDSTVMTTGVGAHGLMAQSVGGGGGLIANYRAGDVPVVTETLSTTGSPSAGLGDGGDVSITASGTIQTSGAGAFGVLAQSVGGGGGFVANNGSVFAGSTSFQDPDNASGDGGSVTIDLPETQISAVGENSVGVWAQSVGREGWGQIVVNVGRDTTQSAIMGGSGAGAGIVLMHGSDNQVNIGAGSSVQALSGVAIQALHGTVDVSNGGTLIGSTLLGSTGSGSVGTLHNAGTVVAPVGQDTVIDGNFVQTDRGRLAPHLDYGKGASGTFVVTGSTMLGGTLSPVLRSAMPHQFLPVLTTRGLVTGSLGVADSPLFSYTARENGGTHEVAISGTTFAAPELGLNTHKRGVARSLENVFASGNVGLATFFANLNDIALADTRRYEAAIGELSPRSTMTLLSHTAASASDIADASMGCPTSATGLQHNRVEFIEHECGYLVIRGGETSLNSDADRSTSRMTSMTLQGGGQWLLQPGLFLGGALAYQRDDFSSRSDGVSATGSSVQGAVTLKRELGAWSLSGAIFGNYGEYDIKRRIDIPGFSAMAKGTVPAYSIGLRTRVAYTAGAAPFYVRPLATLDLVHARSQSFTEKGAGDLGLRFASSNYNTAILTPEIELGHQHDLASGGTLRGFVSVGASLRSNDTWHGRASFVGGDRSPSFDMRTPVDRVAWRLGAGVDVYTQTSMNVQFRYDASLGREARSHRAMANFAYRF